jgi:hypothetical protein
MAVSLQPTYNRHAIKSDVICLCTNGPGVRNIAGTRVKLQERILRLVRYRRATRFSSGVPR